MEGLGRKEIDILLYYVTLLHTSHRPCHDGRDIPESFISTIVTNTMSIWKTNCGRVPVFLLRYWPGGGRKVYKGPVDDTRPVRRRWRGRDTETVTGVGWTDGGTEGV